MRMGDEPSQDFERHALDVVFRYLHLSCKTAQRNPRPIAGVAVTVLLPMGALG